MFERVAVRQLTGNSIEQPVDLGVVAEGLFFYSEVILVADYGALRALLASLGPEVVIELVETETLKLVYCCDRGA